MNGWAVGEGGTIIHTTDGGTVSEIKIEGNSNTSPDNFILYQNYPNPFNPTTKIKFTILESPLPGGDGRGGLQLVKLVVFDILGNEVATLVNEEKPAGSYEVQFDASKLVSGVYFYQLRKGSFSQTRKMVLMR